jgi:ATP-dependent RNA helicase DOB1
MEACAAWTRGQRFADVLNLAPDVFEGSLVRAVRRLEELMRQVGGGGGGSPEPGKSCTCAVHTNIVQLAGLSLL